MFDIYGYSIADFFLYAPETYLRLLAAYNSAYWPAQIVTLGLAMALIALARTPGPAPGRAISLGLAASWAWAGHAFFMERYADLHFAAWIFGWGFFLEAALLLWLGVVRTGLRFAWGPHWTNRLGLALAVFAVALLPLAERLAGRAWSTLDTFPFMPDPVAVATFGFALMARRGAIRLWLLLPIPLAWSVIGAANAWTMGAYENLVTPAAAVLTLAALAGRAIASIPRRT